MWFAIALLCLPDDSAYDPLRTSGTQVMTADRTVHDANRDREIPIRIYAADDAHGGSAPVVLFSHGLGGSRYGSSFLGRHWAARGYVAVFLQHPGSDEGIWKGVPPRRRRAALAGAASATTAVDRFRDVPAVLDQLTQWNADAADLLHGRLDLTNVGMSGHSFGAVTTQAVAGQSDPGGRSPFREDRIRAAIAFSPSPPRRGDADAAFATVDIPWMLMTGSEDGSPEGIQGSVKQAADRRLVYRNLPDTAAKYEVVFHRAEHHAFTDHPARRGQAPRNPAHHPDILALSTAFWDTHLNDDPAAKAWLHGRSPAAILAADDEWQMHEPQSDRNQEAHGARPDL